MIEQLTKIQLFAVWLLPILFAVTVHEAAHGFTANLFGDKTALLLGRVTLNPLRHIDIIGTIVVPTVLLLFGGMVFGWAKPVPINPLNLSKPRRDLALVALSGPLSNIIMALLWAGIAKIGMLLLQHDLAWAVAIIYMGKAGIMINFVLAVLNLLPLPPLDGGGIVTSLLPPRLAIKFSYIAPFGFFILLFLAAFGMLSSIINPVVVFCYTLVAALFGL